VSHRQMRRASIEWSVYQWMHMRVCAVSLTHAHTDILVVTHYLLDIQCTRCTLGVVIEVNNVTQYIAWMNGTSVKRGTVEECESAARTIFQSKSWRDTVTSCGRITTLRITKGARQTLVTERVMHDDNGDDNGVLSTS
jgi:hypothetical protein